MCSTGGLFYLFDADTGVVDTLPRHDHIDGLSHCVGIPSTKAHGPRVFVLPIVCVGDGEAKRTVRYLDVNRREWKDTTFVLSSGSIAVTRLTDTKLVVCGCLGTQYPTGKECFLFDVDTYELTELPDRRVQRFEAVAVHYRGMAVLIGGYDGTESRVSSCEQYNPGAVAWEPMGDMPIDVLGGTRAAVVDDKIYVTGAFFRMGTYMYDGTTWHSIDVMWDSWDRMHCVPFDYKGTLAILCDEGRIKTMDTETNTWIPLDGVTGPSDWAVVASRVVTF